MPEKTNFVINGMSCEHCVKRITQAAESIEGVSDIVVDLASGKFEATVESPDKIEEIKEAVREAGYEIDS